MNYKIGEPIYIQDASVCWSELPGFKVADLLETNLKVWINKARHKQYGIDIYERNQGHLVMRKQDVLLSVNDDWSEAWVTLLDYEQKGFSDILFCILLSYFSTRHGLMVHSSLVDFNGRGILFIGPSGIGKTTQAELWQKYRDAIIINGDMALIHFDGEKYSGHGCPWHGSSPYCENREVPLSAIIVLEQAKENTIERLQGISLVERMMQNVFLPQWYEAGVEAVMETLDGLVGQVPVYLMKCRPDEESVEMVEQVLMKHE